MTHLASRARAMMPAARGAEADVPVWESVHFCLRSVVTCNTKATHTHTLVHTNQIRAICNNRYANNSNHL